MRRIHPLPELLFADLADGSKAFPIGRVVGQVSTFCCQGGLKAIHDFVFVERTVLLHLVNDVDLARGRVVGQEHVDVVAVHTLRAADIAVVVVHRHAPRLAVGIYASAGASFRVLDGDIVAVQRDVAFLVVAGFLLRFGRIGRHLLSGIVYFLDLGHTFGIIQEVFIGLAFGSNKSVVCLAVSRRIATFALRRQAERRVGKGTDLFRCNGRQYEELPVLTFGLSSYFFQSSLINIMPMHNFHIVFMVIDFQQNHPIIPISIRNINQYPIIGFLGLLVLTVQGRII